MTDQILIVLILFAPMQIIQFIVLFVHWQQHYYHDILVIILYYCNLHERIKGFNCSITTILFEVGSYRTVVG